MNPPRVIIAEDDESMQYTIRRLVVPHCEVLAAVTNGRELLEAIDRECPDLILIDISMPVIGGIAVARRLRNSNCDTKTIFVTAHREPEYIEEAFRVGARGYVLKDALTAELPAAITHVLGGGIYKSPRLAK
jgi:DNA-binding NarL/FixJ family response regulator